MNFGDQLKRIRHKLRDPDGDIWTRSFLKTAYNDIQRDLQRKTRVLEQAAVLKYPPSYQASFMHDWEWTYLPSDKTLFFQCLRYHQQADYTFCHRWEAQADWGASDVVTDVGVQFSQPWEAFMGETPSVPIQIKFPSNFHTAKFLAWNKWPIEYRSKKDISCQDSSYETREGTPVYYYREDDYDNSFIPYPRPSTVSWEDVYSAPADPIYVYSHDWESDYVTGEKFTREDEDNERDYLYTWELDIGSFVEDFFRAMWLFEIDKVSGVEGGQVLYLEDDDLNTETGTIMRRDGSLINQDAGAAIDVLEAEDDFFLVYDAEPTEIQDDSDESDLPVFLRKYIEYGVLERAYGSLTDGKIGSLKDYWGMRYKIGIETIKMYVLKKKTDRNYRLMTSGVPVRRTVRHPSLPSTYPAV